MPKDNLRSILAAAQARKPVDPQTELSAMMLAMSKIMAETVSGTLKGQVSQEVIDSLMGTISERMEKMQADVIKVLDYRMDEADRRAQALVDALDAEVGKRIVSALAEFKPEMPESVEMEMEVEPAKQLDVRRDKDGMAVSMSVDGTVYDLIRNKDGFLKGARLRG